MTKFFEKLYGSKIFVFLLLPIILFATLVFSWNLARKDIEYTSSRRFEIENEFIIETFEDKFDLYTQSLYSLDAFFQGSENVTRKELEEFVEISNTINLLPGISSVSYAEKVEQSEISQLEERIRSEEPYKDISFENFLVYPFVEKETYYPVTMVSPIVERNSILGFDLSTDEVRKNALDRAETTNGIAASDIYSFINTGKPGFLLVKEFEKNNETLGMIVESFRADDFFSAVFEDSPFNESVEVLIVGRDNESIENFEISSLLDDKDKIYYKDNYLTDSKFAINEINIADKKWTIITQAPRFYNQERNSQIIPLLVVVGIGAILSLFYVIILSLRNSKSRIEKSVKEQTKLLSDQNKNLFNLKNMLSEAQSIAQIASWEINWKTKSLSYSEEILRIFNTKKTKLENLDDFLVLFGSKNKDKLMGLLEEATKKQDFDVDLEVSSKASSRWLKVKAFFDDKDNIIKGTVQDITKEKLAKLDLEEQKDELERLNSIMIDRELKMIELKEKIKKLEK